jgi:hypothetical protein
MARYINTIETTKDMNTARFVAEDFFSKEGFVKINYKGEEVWKKGIGLLTTPQFFKVTYAEGKVYLQAWLKYAILPGVYLGEMGITGAFAFAIKKVLASRVKTLEALIK